MCCRGEDEGTVCGRKDKGLSVECCWRSNFRVEP